MQKYLFEDKWVSTVHNTFFTLFVFMCDTQTCTSTHRSMYIGNYIHVYMLEYFIVYKNSLHNHIMILVSIYNCLYK